MRAMIMAAGAASRQRPQADGAATALTMLGGTTVVEHLVNRMSRGGVGAVIVSVPARADRLIDLLEQRERFPIPVELSLEEKPLETGGSLRQAAWFFDSDQQFIVHDVHALTDVDFRALIRSHIDNAAYATIAVRQRTADSGLLFDSGGRLCARHEFGQTRWVNGPMPAASLVEALGVHAIAPKLLHRMPKDGQFELEYAYLRLAKAGLRVSALRCDNRFYVDLGTLDGLERARRYAASGALPA